MLQLPVSTQHKQHLISKVSSLGQSQTNLIAIVVAAKINRASSKMTHWEQMAHRLQEMKEVQVKQNLVKEERI